ncbi:cation transporter [Bacillus sp. AFS040349]|nr:cation transporter [Bacillus sp. AFS040349]
MGGVKLPKKHTSTQNTKLAFFLNLAFTIIEYIGGFLTNSMAILSDATHDLGDSISLGTSWYLQRISNKESDGKYSFGYKRFSTLGALISGIVLTIGSIIILIKSVPRLFNPTHPDAQGMLWLALLGVAMNGFAAWKLYKGDSMNESVLSWHLLEDLLGWVGVLIISIVLMFKDIHILDPILSIVISTFVLINVIRKLMKTMKVFLNAVPDGINLESIQKKMMEVDRVKKVSHLHIWSIDGEVNAMSVHLYLSENMCSKENEELKNQIRDSVSDLKVTHSIIETHLLK